MLLNELITCFKLEKNREPSDENELLDYVRYCYLTEKVSIKQYRSLYQQLCDLGASEPFYYTDEKEEQVQEVI